MNVPSLSVQSSPFSQEQVELLNRLLPTLTAEQSLWLNGFWPGSAPARPRRLPCRPSLRLRRRAGHGQCRTFAAGSDGVVRLAVGQCDAFGGRVGAASAAARSHGQPLCMSEYRTNNLKKATHLLIVSSTHGEGDPRIRRWSSRLPAQSARSET